MRFTNTQREVPRINGTRSPAVKYNKNNFMISRAIQSPKQILPDKRPVKKSKAKKEDIVHVRSVEVEYESRVRDLERKSIDAMRRLEAHMRSRELELKDTGLPNLLCTCLVDQYLDSKNGTLSTPLKDKQEQELNQMKQSLIEAIKEREQGIHKRRHQVEAQVQNFEFRGFD